MNLTYVLTGLGLLLYLLLVWFLAVWLKLGGSDAWVLRIALSLIGVAGAALILYYRRQASQSPSEAPSGSADEVQFVMREANARLRGSYRIRKIGKSIADLPLVLVVGEPGSGKTSVVLESGLEPELLSGHTIQDGSIVPTRTANVWLAANTAILEAGGSLPGDAGTWSRFIRLLTPGGLAGVFRKVQAPRAVVVCLDCTTIHTSDAAAVSALARRYHDALGQVAERWGARLPVYVLFTKLDQVRYFADYVHSLDREQVTEVLGSALPLSEAPAIAYNEHESARLSEAFDGLFYSLAHKRLDCLRLENNIAKLPNVYEFPREFRKLRENLVRFLLDLGRPSQLRVSPFLRGFYFAGTRIIVTEDAAPVPLPVQASGGDAGATRIFSGNPAAFASSQAVASVGGPRRVPEWLFLKQFFSEVLLADFAAREVSGVGTRASRVWRVLYATAIASCWVWIIGATVSWSNNRALTSRANAAAAVLSKMSVQGRQLSSSEALHQMDTLHKVAGEVTRYERFGAPMSFRWGIYPGRELYDSTRNLYCREFGRLMLAPVRTAMETDLARLRGAPGPRDNYERPFRALKAYLMMTSHHTRTDPDFLSTALTGAYSSGREVPDVDLVRKQFDFYSRERANELCAAAADDTVVKNARTYLWAFQPADRIYNTILTEISRRGSPLRFTDPSGAVIDRVEQPWPFTRDGGGQFLRAIQEVTRYYSQDHWVLGTDSSSIANQADLQANLRQRYTAEYKARWHTFLNGASISRYANFGDASRKLDGITSAQSSLLKLFCTISVNTAINVPEIAKEFQPFHALTPPATCEAKLNDTPTQQYMTALATMKFQVDELAKKPDVSDARIDSVNAKVAAKTTSQTLNLPHKGETLLLDPILYAEALVEKAAPGVLNGKGADFCRQVGAVFRRFPLNPSAAEDLTLADLQTVFLPDTGTLWKFYQENLQDLLTSAGASFVSKPGARLRVTGTYLAFFNRSANVSRTVYSTNPTRALLAWTVQSRPSVGIESFSLIVNSKAFNGTGRGGETQDFTWTGDSDKIVLSLKTTTGSTVSSEPATGPWALWHFLASAQRRSEGNTVFEYDPVSGMGRNVKSIGATMRLHITGPAVTTFANAPSACAARIAE